MEKITKITAAARATVSHWWDEHPPADPVSEPLYAQALEGHMSEVA